MKETYVTPETEVIRFETEDVITTSVTGGINSSITGGENDTPVIGG